METEPLSLSSIKACIADVSSANLTVLLTDGWATKREHKATKLIITTDIIENNFIFKLLCLENVASTPSPSSHNYILISAGSWPHCK